LADTCVIVKPVSVADVENAPNVTALLDEYASYSLPELPHPNTKFDVYHHLESIDALRVFGAFDGDKLVGFITVLLPTSSHYGFCVPVTESFFVSKEYRASGAARKLIDAARLSSKNFGANGLVIVLPPETKDAVAERLGLRLINKSYLMETKNGT
jgi:hypothetical protein